MMRLLSIFLKALQLDGEQGYQTNLNPMGSTFGIAVNFKHGGTL